MKRKIAKELREKGIQASIQRIKILDFLHGNKTHPTIDDVYKHLKNELPSLSKTTVYNTVKLLVNYGMIQEIHFDENHIRLDYNLKQHAHFYCVECGEISDFFGESYQHILQEMSSYKINELKIIGKGICKKCLKK